MREIILIGIAMTVMLAGIATASGPRSFAMAVGKLPARSCLIDGEAIVCDENGLADFELIRRHGALASAVLCAFDLLELDGRDLRRPYRHRTRQPWAGLIVEALSALSRM